jgi:hypothetical protein
MLHNLRIKLHYSIFFLRLLLIMNFILFLNLHYSLFLFSFFSHKNINFYILKDNTVEQDTIVHLAN